MISADIEGQGITGLLVGYSTPTGGVVAWHRGNLDAFAPQSAASFQAIANSQFPAPFMQEAQTFNVSVRPDFLAVGDFTGHGQIDLAVAARGGNAVYILSGDGKGHFTPAATITAQGGVTALAAERFGKIHSALLVGASGPQHSFLTVYGAGAHGLATLAALPLKASASNILFGEFGDPGPDAAFLSGGQVFILRSSNMQLANVPLPVSASAFALGSFLFDRNGGSQIAVLGVDGSIQIAVRNEFDGRTYTNEEFQAIRQARLSGQTPPLVPAHTFAGNGWRIVEGFASLGSVTAGQTPLFFRTRISVNGADDILWLGAAGGQMVLISHPDQQPGAATFRPGQISVKSYNGSPVRALPMRTNVDGRLGIVALHQGQTAPVISSPIPDPVFTVNRNDDPTPASPITNACNGAANDCSLREAILRANGDTVMVPAGTYTLTIAKVAGDCTGNFGALSVENNVTIMGSVDGSGNPTSIIQAGATAYNQGTPDGVDMVMNVNEDLGTANCPVTSATASLSNLILQNGHNRGTHGNDGDGGCMEFDTGASGTATLTLNNVILQNCDTTQGSGGGLANFNFEVPTAGGQATISNSIIQGNSVTDNSTPGPNVAGGGGIWVSDPSQLTMSNTKVLNNLATQTSGGSGPGGGLFIVSQGTPGETPTTQIHSSTISGNQSSIEGGGIFDSANLVIDSGTIISGNKNGQNGGGPTDGGGLFVNPAVGNSAALSKVTIINNQSTGTGGGIATGAVGAGSVSLNFSRVAGNTAATTGSNLQNLGSTVNATNSWWGTNSPSGTINTATGTTTFDPFIVLNNTANPGQIQPGQTSTVTGDMSLDNHGNGAALAGNLDVLNGLSITFDNAVLGTITESQPEALNANAQATATFTAGATGGTGSVDAVVDQQTVTAQITIVAPPTAAKAFNPAGIPASATSVLTITITNPAANTQPLTGLAFTDNFPPNVTVASPGGLTNTCGGTATAPDLSTSVSLTGGTVATNSSCTVSVTVTSAFTGSYVNSLGPVSSNAGNSNSPSATLSVASPPTISKLFLPTTISSNGSTLLSFTINNPNSNSTPPNNDMVLTGIQFTDVLPAGLMVATPNQLSNTCDGTVTADPGSTTITLTGGDLGAAVQLRPRGIKLMNSRGASGIKLMSQPSSNGSCFISLEVQPATPTTTGTFNNTTGPISANESGAGQISNTASLTVQAAPIVTPPTASKAFGAASFALNGTTSLTFTITNPNATASLVNVGLNDTLPAGLVVAAPGGASGSCIADSAVVFANAGSQSVNMVGLVLPGNSSCSYSVTVTGVASGNWVNTTSPVTGTFNDGSDNFVGITGNAATASVVVELPPVISKAFSPALIAPNGVSTLIFTITNPSVNLTSELGVAFTDTLPGTLVVATPSNATGNCNGGTFTAVAGTNSISLTGGTIPVNSSCVLSVNVTGAVTNSYTNTTGPVSSTNGGTGNTASATLSIKPANLSITKTHDPADFPRNGQGTYVITVSNDPTAGPTLGTVTVVDNLPVIGNPNNLVPVSMTGTGWTCTLSTLTCTRSDALAPGASYPSISLVVSVPKNIVANVTNSAVVSGGGDPNTHEADDPTHIGPPINVAHVVNPGDAANIVIPAGSSGFYRFDVESSPGLGMLTMSCSGLPAGAACSFNPAQTNQLSTIVTMTITVPPRSLTAWLPGGTTYALLFPALGLVGIVFAGKKGSKKWMRRTLALSGAGLLLALASCGGSPQGMTPPPSVSYPITVTVSNGNVSSSTTVTLNVR